MNLKKKVKEYNLLMIIQLELCMNVQLLHVITTGFWFDIEEKEKNKKQKKQICNSNGNVNNSINNNKKRLEMILILMSYRNVLLKHTIQLLLMEKLKNYNLLMVIKLELYEILL